VGDIAFHFAEKMGAERTEAQTAQYKADRLLRANAMEEQLSIMKEPDDIASAYDMWKKEEENIFNDTEMTSDARKAIGNNYKDFYARSDIGVSSYHRKADINKFDRTYVDAQNIALNGGTDEDYVGENGETLSSEGLYAYAAMKRVGLGTVEYESAVDDIRGFGQTQYYRTMSKMITTDFPRFTEEYDASKLSEYQQQQLSLVEQEVEFKVNNQRTQKQDVKYNELLGRYEDGLLSAEDITKAGKDVGQAFGVEFPLLTESREGVLQSMLYGQQISEEGTPAYLMLQKSIGKLADEQFNTGDVDNILRKLYIPQKNGTFKPRFSKETTSNILEQINSNLDLMKTIDIKKGPGGVSSLSTEEKAIFRDITDTFDSFTVNAERRGEIAIGVRQVEGLYKKFYDKIGSGEDISEWAAEALKPYKQQNAKDKAIIINSPVIPVVTSQEEFDAIPSGAMFIEDGKELRKL
jgi:hypothetical protein